MIFSRRHSFCANHHLTRTLSINFGERYIGIKTKINLHWHCALNFQKRTSQFIALIYTIVAHLKLCCLYEIVIRTSHFTLKITTHAWYWWTSNIRKNQRVSNIQNSNNNASTIVTVIVSDWQDTTTADLNPFLGPYSHSLGRNTW